MVSEFERRIMRTIILIIYLYYQQNNKDNTDNQSQIEQLQQQIKHYQTLYENRVEKDIGASAKTQKQNKAPVILANHYQEQKIAELESKKKYEWINWELSKMLWYDYSY